MKYIIDIPNADVGRWVGETPFGKKLYIPISVEDGEEYFIATKIYVEEHTEPDRKAIEDAQEEAWEFAKQVTIMTPDDKCELWGTSKYNTINLGYSYAEAKTKYEAWKKQKDEIRVGDEVIPLDTQYDTMVVTKLWVSECHDEWVDTIASDGKFFSFLTTSIKKTGRHFDDVEELLKKMRI